MMQVSRNRHVLSEQTSDSSAFLNVMCLLKYVLSCKQHFSYSDPDYPTCGLTVSGLARVYCVLLTQYTTGACTDGGNIQKFNELLGFIKVELTKLTTGTACLPGSTQRSPVA
jgi:hypothetical protein